MALLLALETSSVVCSVALYNKQQLLGMSEIRIEKSHATYITIMIDQLLQNCQVSKQELSAIAVSGGPGSYTGLRVGSSTAKGLCFALDIPLIEVPTMQAMAYEVICNVPTPEQFWYCPMIDARRMEVYTCLLDNQLQEKMPPKPAVLETSFLEEERLQKPVLFFGSGAPKFKSLLPDKTNALFLESVMPSAKAVGYLAWPKYQQQTFEDVAYYEPFYLKEVYITESGKKK
jgi:tRNA threonylcarbamoyladenosine biosynthesis protein TsaB